MHKGSTEAEETPRGYTGEATETKCPTAWPQEGHFQLSSLPAMLIECHSFMRERGEE